MNWFKNFLETPSFQDEETTRQGKLLNAILLTNLVIWIVSYAFLPFSDSPVAGAVVITTMILAGLTLRSQIFRGQVFMVAKVLVGFLVLSTTAILVIMGTSFNPEIAGYLIAIMIAGLALNLRSTLYVAAFCTLAMVGVILADHYGLLFDPPLLGVSPTATLAIGMVNTFATTALIFFAMRSIREAMISARERQAELSSAVETNQQLLNTLEGQIAERTSTAETARQEAEAARRAVEAQIWEKTNQAMLIERMRGMQTIPELAGNVIQQICQSLDAQVGVLYILKNDVLELVGSHAYVRRKGLNNSIRLGDAIIGQAALEKQMFTIQKVPEDYLTISAGITKIAPRQILVAPFQFENEVVGVIEIAGIREFTEPQLELLRSSSENIAIAFKTAQARAQIDSLLSQTQQQASALQYREEELKATNEELQAQTANQRASQERLRKQQIELENANAELEEKASALQQQKTLLDQQNADLVNTQRELQRQAEQLAQANRYKSEFLTTMSHELRTPLNSLLILARMLANNEEGNLTVDQVKSARVIYNSGSDLLGLINDILDLSKVEAGRMEFFIEPTSAHEIIETIRAQFTHVAEERHIVFDLKVAQDFPARFSTDSQRLKQILKNLLSNAFKFTDQGKVELLFALAIADDKATKEVFSARSLDIGDFIMIQVSDTGIGIPPEKQRLIFEAFQQVDGSTSRRYGGTGLGLAITREMINHLGGFITLSSTPGQGSLFRIFLPVSETAQHQTTEGGLSPAARTAVSVEPQAYSPSVSLQPTPKIPQIGFQRAGIEDDRHSLTPDSKVLLIIEDDRNFADIVLSFARKMGFKGLVAGTGEDGLVLARQYRPQAVILDLHLPGISGWEVLNALKSSPDLRHIPVHIMSVEDESVEAFHRGVIGYLTKPVGPEALNDALKNIEVFISRSIKTLLLVEDDAESRFSITKLLSGSDIQITEATTGEQSLELLHQSPFDCLIVDLNLPDISGFDLLSQIHNDESLPKCPIIVYTGRNLTEEENTRLIGYADSVIVKGVKSPERLLDETALFLHRVISDLPEEKQAAIKQLYSKEESITGKHVLIVDDDMRNSFAISRLLGEKGMLVEIAANGQKALDWLEENKPVDIILMDIMMPVMDGFETIRRIRQIPHLRKIPILALTAKAMKGDRERCIEAGANDYLSKPIDPERLFSMLRVWLYQ